jgi:NodT family efflux transporter outer membrane factor (OMF) lipoprotein
MRRCCALLVAGLLATGCADMGGLRTQSSPRDQSALAAGQSLSGTPLSPSAWPKADWWKQFSDPQLDQLIEEALAGSPSLRAASARVRKADSVARSLNAALYPHVDGNASITRQRFPEHGLFPPPIAGSTLTQPQLQASLSYEVDFWGKNRAAYESAIGQARAAEVDAFAARLALSVNVAQAYVQLERAYVQLAIAQKSLKEREHFHALTLERFNNGFDTRLAVKQAEGALPASREQIAALEETIGLVRNQLAALLGQGPDRGLAITRPAAMTLAAAALPTNVPAELLGRRPDLVAQRWRIESAGKEIDAAKARFYPNVNLTAFIGFQSVGLSGFLTAANRALGAGSALTLPIFDAGRLRANLSGTNADYDAAVETYNQAVADALREVVDQLTSMRSIAEQRKQQALAEASAKEAYDLALLRFREGLGNYLEVITADAQLLSQQSLDVDLRARELGASINLVRALGGGLDKQPGTGEQP